MSNPYDTITPGDIASGIKSTAREMIGFIRSMLGRMYAGVNTPGQQQAVIDALDDPQRELANYAVMQTALAIVTSPATAGQRLALLQAMQAAIAEQEFPLGVSAPAPSFEVYQPQEDGGVLYAEPVVPVVPVEPVEEEE